MPRHRAQPRQTGWRTCGILLFVMTFLLLFIYTGCVNNHVSWAQCLLQHITSFHCLMGPFTSAQAMILAGHGCQLQNCDRVPAALFMEMSHWGKRACILRPMYGQMNNGWWDGGAGHNCNPCLTKIKIWPYPYPWSLSQVILWPSQKMAEQLFSIKTYWYHPP